MAQPSSLRSASRLAALRLIAAGIRVAATRPAGEIRRLLVLRPDHLGDLLFATPALRRLRAALPEAEIVALVGPWGAPVLARNPAVTSLITWDIPWFNRRARRHPTMPYLSAVQLARILDERRFDAALDLRFDFWWGALAAQLAGVPRRVGYAVPEVAPFLTESVPYVGCRHEVERNLALAGALVGRELVAGDEDRLEFPVRPEEADEAEALLAGEGVRAGEPILAVHPGAGSALKLWTPEGFAAVADTLADRLSARVILTGSAAERDLAATVAERARLRMISVAGRTSLGALAAIFRRARLVVGTDSGPLHLAVAVGAPTVHLFGPVDHRTFGPWGDPARHAVVRVELPCAPCNRLDACSLPGGGRPCMLAIPPGRVIVAAERVLAATEA